MNLLLFLHNLPTLSLSWVCLYSVRTPAGHYRSVSPPRALSPHSASYAMTHPLQLHVLLLLKLERIPISNSLCLYEQAAGSVWVCMCVWVCVCVRVCKYLAHRAGEEEEEPCSYLLAVCKEGMAGCRVISTLCRAFCLRLEYEPEGESEVSSSRFSSQQRWTSSSGTLF